MRDIGIERAGVDPRAEPDPWAAAGERVRHGATTFAARARSERRGDLTLNQTSVLGLLHQHGPMTPGEIAHRLRSRPQSLTRTFASIDDAGWSMRTPDPGDGRQSLLTITESGRAAIRAEMRPRAEWVARVMEQELTVAERDLLVVAAGLLERLAEIDAGVGRREP